MTVDGPDRVRDRVRGLCRSDARTEMSGVGMDTEGQNGEDEQL